MEINIVRTDGMTGEERLQIGLERYRIPRHMHEGVKNYVLRGILCGDFLELIIANDFYHAAMHADIKNQDALFAYAGLLYNYFPSRSHGSEEKYNAWIEKHRLAKEEAVGENDKK